jgi:glutamate racemase
VGPGITLIDSATETAKEVAAVLDKLKWRRPGQGAAERSYYVTDTPARFEKLGKLFLGDADLTAEQVKVGGV